MLVSMGTTIANFGLLPRFLLSDVENSKKLVPSYWVTLSEVVSLAIFFSEFLYILLKGLLFYLFVIEIDNPVLGGYYVHSGRKVNG